MTTGLGHGWEKTAGSGGNRREFYRGKWRMVKTGRAPAKSRSCAAGSCPQRRLFEDDEKIYHKISRYIKQGCPETWVHCKQLSCIKVVRVELCCVVLQSDCCDAVALGWVKKWRLTELNWQAQPFCTCAEILSVLRL